MRSRIRAAASETGTAHRCSLPGLWGYFGVDLILSGGGPVVVDVNPRLTTSYAGLRPALGINAAGMVLAALRGDEFGVAALPPGRPVAVDPSAVHERPQTAERHFL